MACCGQKKATVAKPKTDKKVEAKKK